MAGNGSQPKSSSKFALWTFVGVIVLVGVGLATASVKKWQPDFANTAWGAIVGAVITGIFGVLLKSQLDKDLAETQSRLTADVQAKLDSQRTDAQKEVNADLAKLQGEINSKLELQRGKTQTELEDVRAILTDRNSALSARRAYEYDALKRLYADIEPILFQLYEGLDEAQYRVRSVARTDRDGNLDGRNGTWLGGGYYLVSTVHKLILPVTHLRLMQRKMTFVDLSLDHSIETKYSLLRLYVRSFTDDFDFARLDPKLQYDPNARPPQGASAAVFRRQALLVGTVESLADLLIVDDTIGKSRRSMSFGEFETLSSQRPIQANLDEALELFRGFSPSAKPVLARLMIAQACLARFLMHVYHNPVAASDLKDAFLKLMQTDTEFLDGIRWSHKRDDELDVARAYWADRLERLGKELTIRRASGLRSGQNDPNRPPVTTGAPTGAP